MLESIRLFFMVSLRICLVSMMGMLEYISEMSCEANV
jgi:hypothetical protein